MPARGDPRFVRLYKLRPLLDALKTRFKQQYSPHYIQAINEATIVYNRGTSLKQYIPLNQCVISTFTRERCLDIKLWQPSVKTYLRKTVGFFGDSVLLVFPSWKTNILWWNCEGTFKGFTSRNYTKERGWQASRRTTLVPCEGTPCGPHLVGQEINSFV